jgi:hypothetical protein
VYLETEDNNKKLGGCVLELGRESEGRELGLGGILEGQGLEADEAKGQLSIES